MSNFIGCGIFVYTLGAVLYRHFVTRWWHMLLWPFFLARTLAATLTLYLRTPAELVVSIHPWVGKHVRVADTPLNNTNEHWKHHIGKVGKVISATGDDCVSVWLDDEIVPHQNILTERFILL